MEIACVATPTGVDGHVDRSGRRRNPHQGRARSLEPDVRRAWFSAVRPHLQSAHGQQGSALLRDRCRYRPH